MLSGVVGNTRTSCGYTPAQTVPCVSPHVRIGSKQREFWARLVCATPMSGPPAPPPFILLPPAIPSPLLPPPPPPHWLEDFGDGDLGSGEVVGILVGAFILIGICYYERCAPCPGPTRPDPMTQPPSTHPVPRAAHPSAHTPSVLRAAQAPLHVLLHDEPNQPEWCTNKKSEPDGDLTWVHQLALKKSTD